MNCELESPMMDTSCCGLSRVDSGTTTPPLRITPNIMPTASMLFRLSKATLSPISNTKFKRNRTALICGERRLNWTDFNCPSQHHRQHTHKSSTLINPAHS